MNDDYVGHIRPLKQTLDHGLISKKVHKVIRFNREAWLKEYIDMNTELRKDFLQINESFSFRNGHGECKDEQKYQFSYNKYRSQLVSEPNYHVTKFFNNKNKENKSKNEEATISKPVDIRN